MQNKQVIISVIIPAYNAEKTISKTLRSLEKQDIQKELFEVIIIDNGSNDKTKHIVQTCIRNEKIQLYYLYYKKTGVGIARNFGISKARGQILAFTDADCICDKDRLSVIQEHILKKGAKFIGGEVYSHDSIIYPWKMAPVKQMGITANMALDYRDFQGDVFSGTFLGMFGEDTDLKIRMEKKGIPLIYVPEIKVQHPANILSLKQIHTRFQGRENDILLYKKYKEKVLSSYNPIFQPRILGRVSYFSTLVFFCLGTLLTITFVFGLLETMLFFIIGFLIFYIYLYKFFVIYLPGNKKISGKEKILTFLYFLLIIPFYFYYRIKGIIKFKFFMI